MMSPNRGIPLAPSETSHVPDVRESAGETALAQTQHRNRWSATLNSIPQARSFHTATTASTWNACG